MDLKALKEIFGDEDLQPKDMKILVIHAPNVSSDLISCAAEIGFSMEELLNLYLPSYSPFCSNDSFYDTISNQVTDLQNEGEQPSDYLEDISLKLINDFPRAFDIWYHALPPLFKLVLSATDNFYVEEIQEIPYGGIHPQPTGYLRFYSLVDDSAHDYMQTNPTNFGITPHGPRPQFVAGDGHLGGNTGQPTFGEHPVWNKLW